MRLVTILNPKMNTPLAILIEWMGIPENASVHGEQIDHFNELVHWFMLILFVGWSIFFFYTIWRFSKKRQQRASYHGLKGHASSHVEYGVIIFEAVLLLGFAFPLWAARVDTGSYPTGEDVVRVNAIAYQFGWDFHYPGPDKKFGNLSASLVTTENPIGLDYNDPAAQDDFIAKNKLVAPVDQPLIVEITSKDVIHNFAVKHMRIGQDAIPGLRVPVNFTPIRTGEFEIVCGQLCGSGHYSMKGWLVIENSDDYQSWEARQVKSAQSARQAAEAAETTEAPVEEPDKQKAKAEPPVTEDAPVVQLPDITITNS
jgi:cytochrome c oxidase subunit 2